MSIGQLPDQTGTPTTDGQRPGCLLYGGLTALMIWILTVTALIQTSAWLADQFAIINGSPLNPLIWFGLSLLNAILVAGPSALLAALTRSAHGRAAAYSWAIAGGLMALFAVARLVPEPHAQAAAALQVVLALAGAVLLRVVAGRYPTSEGRAHESRAQGGSVGLALAAAISLPSVAWGALGSLWDTLLALAAGLAFGAVAALLLERHTLARFARQTEAPGQGAGLARMTCVVALFVLAAGFGYGGQLLLLGPVVPPLGLAAIALSESWRTQGNGGRGSWRPFAIVAGLVAAALLAFWDPDELLLVLGSGEVLMWAMRAALVSLLLATLAAAVAGALRTGRQPAARAVALAAAMLAWLGLAAVYAISGQPGFHGERLFVILKDQAGVQPAYAIPDREQRLRYVYTLLTEHAGHTQGNIRSTLTRYGITYRPYYLVNALEVDGGPLVRTYLALQPEVDRILESPRLRPLPAPIPVERGDETQAPPSEPWNVTSLEAERVWRELNVTGHEIVIGQSDSGVAGSHPDLQANYRGRDGQDDFNWLDPWNGSATPQDVGGHGTHTLGSIVGQGGIGLAPGAQWIGCVNLARNLGSPARYLDCLQFMLAPYPRGGDALRDGNPTLAAHILNNSWGCPPIEGCDPSALAPAAGALRAAGIFVVASAGNSGPGCGTVSDPLAIYEDVLTVGAIDENGDVAFFSSRGPVEVDGSLRPKPELLAPGVEILSALPNGTYGKQDGTSMAGPHVAGVVALMWSAQPKLIGNVERTEQILLQSARPYRGEAGACALSGAPNNESGYGVVNAYAAVKMALAER